MIKFDGESLRAALSSTMQQLGEAVGQDAMRAAGFAGAEVFRDEAKSNVSRSESTPGSGPAKRTGTLHKNIIIKRLEEEASDRKQVYLVTVRSGKFGTDGDAFYWRFVEEGHLFVRRKSSSLKKESITKRRKEAKAAAELEFGSSRVAARPFMRPAYESKKQEAVDAMQAKLAEKVREKMGG